MADQFESLIEAAKAGRAAKAFVDQASALMQSQSDAVTFSCANQPYAGVFELTLPRAVWAPELQKQIDVTQAIVDSTSRMVQSAQASVAVVP